MGILPVLFVVIVIVNIALNYKKAQEKRMQDMRKRMENKKNMSQNENAAEKKPQKSITFAPETPSIKTIQIAKTPENKPVRSRVNVKDIKKAVIMAEILNKPVSLRDQ